MRYAGIFVLSTEFIVHEHCFSRMATPLFFLALVTETATQSAPAQTGLSPKEQSVRALYRAVDAGDAEGARAFLAADLRVQIPVSAEPLDLDAFLQFIQLNILGFPDLEHRIVEAVSVDNKLQVNGLFCGTNSGPYHGMPPTYNRVEVPYTTEFTFNTGGRIAAMSIRFDPAVLGRQLQGA